MVWVSLNGGGCLGIEKPPLQVNGVGVSSSCLVRLLAGLVVCGHAVGCLRWVWFRGIVGDGMGMVARSVFRLYT